MPIGDRGGRSRGPRQPVSGHVATVTFVMDLPAAGAQSAASRSQNDESELLYALQREYGEELHIIARREFRRVLGPRVEVDPVAIRQGSIEVVVIVSAIAAALGHYNELVSKMSEAIESTRRLYRQSMGLWQLPGSTANMILVADWEPGAAALQLEASSDEAENLASLRSAGGSQTQRLEPGVRRELMAVAWTAQMALLVALLVLVITRT